MARLEVQRLLPRTDVRLRTPVNWTAVIFFAGLSALHLYNAVTAMMHHRWDGYMSIIFGGAFALIAVACGLVGTELTVMSQERRVRVRTGTRRLYTERFVPFGTVRAVRLTLLNAHKPRTSTIELVCDHEVLECPPTAVPREEALCLAMTIGARLVKVYGDAYGPVAERLNNLPASNPEHHREP
jgi:hypothetical protein